MYVPGKSSDTWSFPMAALARKTVEMAAPRPDAVALRNCFKGHKPDVMPVSA